MMRGVLVARIRHIFIERIIARLSGHEQAGNGKKISADLIRPRLPLDRPLSNGDALESVISITSFEQRASCECRPLFVEDTRRHS